MGNVSALKEAEKELRKKQSEEDKKTTEDFNQY